MARRGRRLKRARPRRLTLALACLSLALAGLSCAKARLAPPAADGSPAAAAAAPESPPAASQETVVMQGREDAPPDAGRPSAEPAASVAGAAVAGAPPVAPAVAPARTPTSAPVSASSNMAGRDRFLTIRPFDAVSPVDFEIGPLMSSGADASIASAIAALKEGFAERKLADRAMSESGAAICGLLYAEALASGPAISETRAGEPEFQPGGGANVALRLFSAAGSATGFAVLYPDAGGTWLIEHLELDLASLAASVPRETPWDPYAGTDAP